jgi:hypothetical protein
MTKYNNISFSGCDYYVFMEKDQFLAFVKEYDLPIFADKKGEEFSWYKGLMIGILK